MASFVPKPSQKASVLVASPLMRALLMVVAVLSLGLALLGAITPGLPSTEFVLIAAWAAARSSPRFHAWLLRHRLFGPVLHDWQNGRCIRRKAKWMATASMAVCSVLMIAVVPHAWLVMLAVVCMLAVQVWLWRQPEPELG
ncbi:UNVERIFIED_ORG: uncharacterized membrane protein YbaN (DUF454 family) [Comamonas terrigena]